MVKRQFATLAQWREVPRDRKKRASVLHLGFDIKVVNLVVDVHAKVKPKSTTDRETKDTNLGSEMID